MGRERPDAVRMIELTVQLAESITIKEPLDRRRVLIQYHPTTICSVIQSTLQYYDIRYTSPTNFLDQFGLVLVEPQTTAMPGLSFSPLKAVPLMEDTKWLDPNATVETYTKVSAPLVFFHFCLLVFMSFVLSRSFRVFSQTLLCTKSVLSTLISVLNSADSLFRVVIR